MNESCREFRSWLAEHLHGRSTEAYEWHGHLVGCPDCRAVLDAEQALEALLVSMPEPQLPPDLARRVLSRLEGERRAVTADGRLDALLARAADVDVPPDLGARVLAGVRAEHGRSRFASLDEVLAADAGVDAPEDLAERMLERLRFERRRAATRPARRLALSLAAAVLVAFLAGFALWTTFVDRTRPTELAGAEPPVEPVPAVPEVEDVPDELLASLDLLESWDVLTDDDLEVVIATLDTIDEVLLDIDEELEEG